MATKQDLLFNITLTDAELTYLCKTLDRENACDNPDHPMYELVDRLTRIIHDPDMCIKCNMYYVSVYSITQVYGGPEEGGWYYCQEECLDCQGVAVNPDTEDPERFNELIALFRKQAEAITTLTEDSSDDVLKELLAEGKHIAIHNLDRYGEGLKVVVEREPGRDEKLHREVYC